ncbi:chromate transporter [Caulobacter sp. KR2-114]|uniref:chromate transporter n=1 Tax=Caulobacter sp. KR2-114 TaxID=3400912 RepID=UPI003C07F46D
MKVSILGALLTQFAILSLMAFGGANAVVPEIQRQAVGVHHWMTDKDFAALFAIAQASPGPNFLIATLVGWKAAGLAGALTATAAMCAPSCLLTYWLVKAWDRYRETRWRNAIAAGVAPVTVGLIASSALVLVRAADHGWKLGIITAATAAVSYFTKYNPLWCLAIAGGLGAVGLLS